MGGRVYAADKGDANGEGNEARHFRSSGPGGRRAELTRADGISEEAKRATSGCLGLREERSRRDERFWVCVGRPRGGTGLWVGPGK